jgi:ribose-phosphate pyrophosphokinase
MLFLLACLKDAGAAQVTAVVPYLCYSRKDRRTQPRDPVNSRYVATLFEAAGASRVVTLDVHNPAAFQNAFRCRTEHLEARALYARHFASLLGSEDPVVVSPDVGGAKRAERLRANLAAALGRPVGNAFVEKYRSGGVVSGEAVVGDVGDKVALIVDDLISTGGTVARAARACRSRGARAVHVVATHALFSGEALATLGDPALDRIVVTNSAWPFRLDAGVLGEKLVVLDVSPLVAEAIRRLHEGGSIVDLVEEGR